jgi:hypothetical protein
MKLPYTRSKTARIIAIAAAVLLPVALAGLGYVAYARYERKKLLNKIKKVLFLGDSQTVPSTSYADLVSNSLGWQYDKLAIVGAKSDWILNKYQENKNPYDAIIVMIGGNDVWGTGKSDSAIENLISIKRLSRQRNHLLIFISPPSKIFYSTDPVKLSEYNKIAEWMRLNGDLFVDGTKLTENTSLFASDKLHLNNSGQQSIAYYLVEALKQA